MRRNSSTLILELNYTHYPHARLIYSYFHNELNDVMCNNSYITRSNKNYNGGEKYLLNRSYSQINISFYACSANGLLLLLCRELYIM